MKHGVVGNGSVPPVTYCGALPTRGYSLTIEGTTCEKCRELMTTRLLTALREMSELSTEDDK